MLRLVHPGKFVLNDPPSSSSLHLSSETGPNKLNENLMVIASIHLEADRD